MPKSDDSSRKPSDPGLPPTGTGRKPDRTSGAPDPAAEAAEARTGPVSANKVPDGAVIAGRGGGERKDHSVTGGLRTEGSITPGANKRAAERRTGPTPKRNAKSDAPGA